MREDTQAKSRPRSCVLIEDHNKVLLIKRINNGNTVYYVLPGGGIEREETPETCAHREIKEELGLSIKVKAIWRDLLEFERETWIVSAIIRNQPAEICWQETSKQTPQNQYLPVWINKRDLQTLEVYPRSLREYFKSSTNGIPRDI